MSACKMDINRRKFLTMTTSVVGGVGVGLAAIPFAGSWLPSAQAKALGAPIDIDITKIEAGQKITVAWRGKPIFIVHRTDAILAKLASLDKELRDPGSAESEQPNYATNAFRAVNEKFLVVEGICTHLGCVPTYKPREGELDASWLGGFFCPCHGSKFDLAGRVYKGVPAPTNLPVPPYRYINDKILRIGEDHIA